MVQVIGQGRVKPPSTSDRLGRAFSTGAGLLTEHLLGEQYRQQEDEAAKRLGLDLSGIRDAGMRDKLLSSQLQSKREEQNTLRNFQNQMELSNQKHNQQLELLEKEFGFKSQKNAQDLIEDEKRYEIVKDIWGPKAAELYKSAPEGGKTSIINSLLESSQRGLNFEDIIPQAKQEEKPSFKTIDYDKGLTPKERADRQEKRYNSNLPLYQESKKKKESLEAERDKLNILQELSPQISGLSRLNLNPQTGELIIPAAASPEVQRYIKTLNDFTTMAKDSYGSRVTNFDLTQYMKRLPSLANSSEARDQIIRQMQIINDINHTKEQALQDIIDEHGGIRNIDFDTAERLAEKESKGMINKLKSEFKLIDNRLEKEYENKIKEKKKASPKGFILMEHDGQFGYVPEKEVKQAIKEGAKAL